MERCRTTGPVSRGSGSPEGCKLMVVLQGLILHYCWCLSHSRGSDPPGNTFHELFRNPVKAPQAERGSRAVPQLPRARALQGTRAQLATHRHRMPGQAATQQGTGFGHCGDACLGHGRVCKFLLWGWRGLLLWTRPLFKGFSSSVTRTQSQIKKT